MGLQVAKHEVISLREHPTFNEAWLHRLIVKDPTILGLGDIDVLDWERTQETGGRLDLLLSDSEKNRRYEVEIMLGATDPSHIVRCIEYWDIERRRYPAYEHIAVLIAEEVTTRFLNVMSLMSGTIPMMAIQLSALKVGDQLVLNFVPVLNQTALREDDTDNGGGKDVDRAHWEKQVGSKVMSICDRVLTMLNENSQSKQELHYKKRHIGLSSGGSIRNFVFFGPKKSFMRVGARVADPDKWLEKLENAGIPCDTKKPGVIKFTVKPGEFEKHAELIRELINQAVEDYQK
ncbi:MAG: hypothetical protein GY869_16735 [Planctomycetes bacterium]|nr:hypothetical protein [Planctomycetota bacterium]